MPTTRPIKGYYYMAFTIFMMIALMIAVAYELRDKDNYIDKRNKQHSHNIVHDDTDKNKKDKNTDESDKKDKNGGDNKNKKIPNGIIPIKEDTKEDDKKKAKIPNGIIPTTNLGYSSTEQFVDNSQDLE